MNPLRSLPLFASLDDETFAELGGMTRTKQCHEGEILFYQGETPKDLIVLTKGVLKLYKTAGNDREIVLHHFSPVSMVAEAALLQGMAYPATATFETEGEVILIEYARFESVFLKNPRLAKMLILSLSQKVRMLESVIERGLVMDAGERVYHLIKTSPELLGTVRHYELAYRLNLTPETFSRTLKKLEKKGKIIRTDQGWKVSPGKPDAST